MRIDKFLKVSRIIKRRTVASDACTGGKVQINNKTAKPGDKVKVGDIIEISLGANKLRAKVLLITEHIKADLAHTMFEIM